MDSMTQSAQISSSQGFADGQNSAAKESKLSDSFLSTSPVSLIQSPQDKKVVVGTDKPSESVTTSLRFPSQPGSFSASNYGSDAVEGQPDSPIKTSPVSERIKALEALAAKKREPEYRDFRDRHHEKSSFDVPKLPASLTKPPIDIPKPSANIPKPSVDKSKPPADIPKLSFDTPRPTMDISRPPSDLPKLPADGSVCSTKKVGPGVCEMEGSPAEESPESPFEVLGELRQGSEYEETEEWMKAHLPPVLDIDAAESNKSTSSVPLKDPNDYPEVPAAFASVPDAFMDSPVESPKLGNELIESQKQPESEEEFDISFLPVAYMCGQQEKANVQDSSNVESVTLPSDAAPAGLDSPSPSVPPSDSHFDAEQTVGYIKDASWGEDLDRPVLSEADSSGESEDTVIEEGVGAPDSALQQSVNPPDLNDPPTASDLCSSEKVAPPPKSERKLMQVPTINVIETDEPNYSDEEMENEPQLTEDDDLEIIDDSNNPRASEPEPQSQDVGPPKTRPLETEFIEGYSPPSSPVDSDAEYSPKHKLPESISEVDPQQSVFKSEVQAEALEKALAGERAQTEKSESMSNTVQNAVMHDDDDVDFPDNNDEWSDEGQDSDLKLREESLSSQRSAFLNQFKVDEQSGTPGPEPCKDRADVSVTSFMQDDIYDRQSFDYENDEPSPLDYSDGKELDKAKMQVLLDPAQEVEEEMPDLESDASFNDDEVLNNPADHASLDEYPQNPYSCFHNQTLSSANEKNTGGNDKLPSLQQGSEIQPDLSLHADVQDQESISDKLDRESSFSEPPNSFVEFMRECLKSRQDEDPDEGLHSISSENELSKAVLPSSQSPPGVAMDLDQQRIAVGALNELGSDHEETPLNLQTKLTDRSEVDGGATSAQPSPFPSVPPSACSQSRSEFDNSYSKEVEAVDEWMAEAYYLAEHILTTILTHLSGNTFFPLGPTPAHLMHIPHWDPVLPSPPIVLISTHSFTFMIMIFALIC
uniref:Uncharacterized protein n=1 Tax=Oryzias sinensis TaxID=183150 RepID=A0A8C7ZH19_9TELE